MPIELIVVGEDASDRQWLLVEGIDGRCYKYHPRRSRLVPIEPDDWWLRNTDPQRNEGEASDVRPTHTG